MQEKKYGVTGKDLFALLETQCYRCALTGRELTPESATLDHKTPVSRGGSHTIENVWIVHMDANRAKSTFTAEEFIALCKEVANTSQVGADIGDPSVPLNIYLDRPKINACVCGSVDECEKIRYLNGHSKSGSSEVLCKTCRSAKNGQWQYDPS